MAKLSKLKQTLDGEGFIGLQAPDFAEENFFNNYLNMTRKDFFVGRIDSYCVLEEKGIPVIYIKRH
tara:strand:- start:6701 stop:6898 length:198 start_codon:yes stop_codon:yes gene_type:complete